MQFLLLFITKMSYTIIMDALKTAETIAKIVSKGRNRKYYRFRQAPFYGGVATADCVGCCLKCIFCWSWNIINRLKRKTLTVFAFQSNIKLYGVPFFIFIS